MRWIVLIRIPFNEMLEKIKEKTGLSDQEINEKIDAKLKQLSGLISKEGAAHILANELSVKLVENSGKVKDIHIGMRNAEFNAKVQQVYETREFARKDGSQGKVGNFLCGDETGVIRVVCWGSNTDILSKLSEGSIIRVCDGFVRDNQGRKEVHLNDKSNVVLDPAGVSIGEIKQRSEAKRKEIKDLEESDDNVAILGTIVQSFEPRFYEVCPDCGKRIREEDGKFACPEHKIVTPDFSYVFNVVVDDGSETMRCVLFRNQAEKLLKKTKEEMMSFKGSPDSFETIKTELLGSLVKFVGRVNKNTFFDRLEFVVQLVFPEPDPAEEIERIKSQ
jgi:replication factor A1